MERSFESWGGWHVSRKETGKTCVKEHEPEIWIGNGALFHAEKHAIRAILMTLE